MKRYCMLLLVLAALAAGCTPPATPPSPAVSEGPSSVTTAPDSSTTDV